MDPMSIMASMGGGSGGTSLKQDVSSGASSPLNSSGSVLKTGDFNVGGAANAVFTPAIIAIAIVAGVYFFLNRK
jgi:hypothetical protein